MYIEKSFKSKRKEAIVFRIPQPTYKAYFMKILLQTNLPFSKLIIK